jgi:hypothetical protein
MGILLTNGDSFTYGDELDGWDTNPPTHEHHTYTFKLSTMIDRKYINLAQNGSSNDKIYRRTMDFLINKHSSIDVDLLVITWSNFGRFEICENYRMYADRTSNIPQESNMNQIIYSHKPDRFVYDQGDQSIPLRREIISRYGEMVLTMQTQIMRTFMYMNHIQFVCDLMKIPVVQGVIHGDMYGNFLATLRKDGWKDYKYKVTEYYNDLREECKIGLGFYKDLYYWGHDKYSLKPRGHADEESHTAYAEMIYDIIKDKGLLDVGD